MSETLSDTKRALLAQRLRRRTGAPPTVPPRPAGTDPLLSFAQERLWFLEQYAPGTTAYTVAVAVRLAGPLDPGAFRARLDATVARHEALRMRLPTTQDGRPELVVDPPGPACLRLAEAADLAAALRLVDADLTSPFDLAAGPLFRCLLVALPGGDHVLLLAGHHAVLDGWSSDVILRELLAGAPPAEPVLGYGDVARWQRAQDRGADLDFWRAALAGLPPLDLPADLPRPAEQSYAGAAHPVAVDAGLTRAVTELGQARGATPFMTLLAAFQLLLARYSGQDDLAVGSPVAGRGLAELDGVVGMFVNTLVLRADLSGDPTFGELLARTRTAALDAYAHQDLPFDQLVSELGVVRDVSRAPLVQATFALQNFATGPPDPRISYLTPTVRTARYDLGLYLFDSPDGWVGNLGYATALFTPATVERLADRFLTLLRAIVARPDVPVSELSLLTQDERTAVLALSAGPPLPPRQPRLLHEALATAPPDLPAVVHGADRLTYRELDELSSRIAGVLREHGAGADTVVAVLLEQSVELAAALLGVLEAGGAYLPLDPTLPAARLDYVLTDSATTLVLTTAGLRALLPEAPASPVPATGLLVVALGRTRSAPGPVTPDHLAYVIYTSGSTGRPKGVAVPHRQVLNYLHGMLERFAPEPGASFALPQSLAFDFGVTTFYLSLVTGGTLHLLDPYLPAAELAARLAGADYVKLTPSHLDALLAEVEPAALAPRRLLLLGGEAPDAVRARALAAHTRVVNHYGPTEATVGVCTAEVTPSGPLPVGRPLPGTRVYLLDDRLRPVPPGLTGEIYLGGDRLARGYLGRPGLTAERFVPDPFGEPGSRMYRTGDLGRWLPTGELAFLGRRDLQVKVRGYRVELGEIEAALGTHPAVTQAVVELRAERLVAYLVGTRVPAAELRAALAERLPEYLLPARYVWLAELPRKAHGKVDRARLPDPGEDGVSAGDAEPETELEAALAEVWAAVLGLARVGVLDDFFELGGHSLLAAQVVARARRLGPDGARPVTILDLFKHRTVRALARLLTAGEREAWLLLHRLTPAIGTVTCSVVCAPYGGGSAVIYQPLADALPAGTELYSIAVPGHELGEQARPTGEVAAGCVAEILAGVPGPVVLYGHCGLGVMLAVEIARGLEAAGRPVEAVYLGGIFPFASPGFSRLTELVDRLRGDQHRVNALRAAGLDTDELDAEQLRLLVANRRTGTREAERYFGRLYAERAGRLRAPVISVAGERDPATEYYQERFREWHLLSDTTAGVVLDEAAHFFLKYRAAELAGILTVHRAIDRGETEPLARTDASTWWLQGVSTSEPGPAGPRPSLRRFGAVAAGQLVSMIGSALTEFAIPIWIYLRTGSIVSFALFAVLALVPGMLVAPLAGAVVDRFDRRRVMLCGDLAAGGAQLAFGLLLWSGALRVWHIYPLLALLSVALIFQRTAYLSAIPQLVPKRFLGHANGFVQVATGTAQLSVPLVAVGLVAAIGLAGILVIDVVSYAAAIAVVLLVRFPATMAWRRRESLLAEIRGGWRHVWHSGGFRAMLIFFALLNVFLSPLLLLITPLVLTFATLADVGRVAFAGGLGLVAGGITMTVWGGPRRRRMRGVLGATLALGLCCLVTGLHRDLLTVAVGAFGMSFFLAVLNGIYATIVQVKVPQRFHGRVIALNTLVAWSTVPLAFGVIAPAGVALLGARIGLLYVLFACAIAAVTLAALRLPALSRFDAEVPDAPPDDLIGATVIKERT